MKWAKPQIKPKGVYAFYREDKRKQTQKALNSPTPETKKGERLEQSVQKTAAKEGKATNTGTALPPRRDGRVGASAAGPCLAAMPDAFWHPAAVTDQLQHTSYWPLMALANLFLLSEPKTLFAAILRFLGAIPQLIATGVSGLETFQRQFC